MVGWLGTTAQESIFMRFLYNGGSSAYSAAEYYNTKAHINNELKLFGVKEIKNEIVDTLILARDKFPGSSVSLDALCKRFKIDNSKRTQHTALIDCDLLAKVYINLIDQKEPTLDFQNNIEEKNQSNNSTVFYFKGIVKPTDQELKKHKEYLKQNLKKNYFN